MSDFVCSLPLEVTFEIFGSCVTELAPLFSCVRVCKVWRDTLYDAEFWKGRDPPHFPCGVGPQVDTYVRNMATPIGRYRKRMSIVCCMVHPGPRTHTGCLESIQHLELSFSRASNAELERETILCCPNLRSLSLEDASYPPGVLDRLLSRLRKLQSLRVRGPVVVSPAMENLRHLTITHVSRGILVSDRQVDLNFSKLKNVEQLCISECDSLPISGIYTAFHGLLLPSLNKLRELTLAGVSVSFSKVRKRNSFLRPFFRAHHCNISKGVHISCHGVYSFGRRGCDRSK